MLDQGAEDTRVTVKWDGAPAVICGIDPQKGDFFVGTKSVFNKVSPKICYLNRMWIRSIHLDNLQTNSKPSYRYLSKLPIRGVVQGDLLFTDDKYVATIGGDRCIAFTPNTITYAVPVKSPLGQTIQTAKLGIVFHTTYSGSTLDTMDSHPSVRMFLVMRMCSLHLQSSPMRLVSQHDCHRQE